MSITTDGHTAAWEEKEHPGELLFVIVRDGIVSLAKQEWVVGQAYMDVRDARHEFGSDWTIVYIKVSGRKALEQAGLNLVNEPERTLVVTSLVTGDKYKFGLE